MIILFGLQMVWTIQNPINKMVVSTDHFNDNSSMIVWLQYSGDPNNDIWITEPFK